MKKIYRSGLVFIFICLFSNLGLSANWNFQRSGLPSLPICDRIQQEIDQLSYPIIETEQLKGDATEELKKVWFDYYNKSQSIYPALAKKIYSEYIQNNIKPREFILCFHARGFYQQASRLESDLPNAFFFSTLQEFASSPSLTIRQFSEEAMNSLNTGEITFLSLDIPNDSPGSDGLQYGGFHRGQSGLYLNPNNLPSDQQRYSL